MLLEPGIFTARLETITPPTFDEKLVLPENITGVDENNFSRLWDDFELLLTTVFKRKVIKRTKS